MAGVRASDHDEKRGLILQRAAELFATQGFHKTTISEITTACKATSKAWLYHYFESKDEILFTLIHDFLSLVNGRIAEALKSHSSPSARLRSFIRESLSIYVDYRINYPKLFAEMSALDQTRQQEIKSIERRFLLQVRDILIELNPNIDKRPHESMALTLLLFGTINWAYIWFNPAGPLSLDELADLAEAMLINGLASF